MGIMGTCVAHFVRDRSQARENSCADLPKAFIMNWELSGVTGHKCPCGQGTYTVRVFVDDWKRSEEQWEMDCPKCKRKYYLYSYPDMHSGAPVRSSRWVKRKTLSRVLRVEARVENAKLNVVNLAASRYESKWLAYFKEAKSKKAAWQRLTDAGRRAPSLTTFYSHTAKIDLQAYLLRQFNFDSLPIIVEKVGPGDKELKKKLGAVKERELELRVTKSRMLRDGFQ